MNTRKQTQTNLKATLAMVQELQYKNIERRDAQLHAVGKHQQTDPPQAKKKWKTIHYLGFFIVLFYTLYWVSHTGFGIRVCTCASELYLFWGSPLRKLLEKQKLAVAYSNVQNIGPGDKELLNRGYIMFSEIAANVTRGLNLQCPDDDLIRIYNGCVDMFMNFSGSEMLPLLVCDGQFSRLLDEQFASVTPPPGFVNVKVPQWTGGPIPISRNCDEKMTRAIEAYTQNLFSLYLSGVLFSQNTTELEDSLEKKLVKCNPDVDKHDIAVLRTCAHMSHNAIRHNLDMQGVQIGELVLGSVLAIVPVLTFLISFTGADKLIWSKALVAGFQLNFVCRSHDMVLQVVADASFITGAWAYGCTVVFIMVATPIILICVFCTGLRKLLLPF
jgi:hypothetical protein